MADAKVTRVVGLSSSVLFDKTNPQNPINRRISIMVMTQDAEQAALAGSDQGVALGKPIPDADTHVPDLSGAAATGTATVGTPAAAGSSTMAPAPAAAGTATPVPAPAAAGTKPAPPRVSSSAQVASAAALAKAAEAAIAAPRVATSESAQPN